MKYDEKLTSHYYLSRGTAFTRRLREHQAQTQACASAKFDQSSLCVLWITKGSNHLHMRKMHLRMRRLI